MQPFTLDQSIIAGLLFLLGLLIGMFLMAGRKWKRRYLDETARVRTLEAENARLAEQLRDHEVRRTAAVPVQTAPVHTAPVQTTVVHEQTRVVEPEPYRRVTPQREDGGPDIVIRRP